MRRFGVLVLALAALLGAATTGLTGDKQWRPITVRWFGQSFFIVESSKGTPVAFDPHLIPEFGRHLGLKADLILLSHNHNDHNRVEALENHADKKVKIIPGLKGTGLRAGWNLIDETVGDVHVRTVGVYHDPAQGMQSGKNAVFVVEMDGWRIAHLGDLGHTLTEEQVKAIGPVDVLMIPVGGIYTINGSEAKKVVEQLRPKEYIFPMHHGTQAYQDLLPATEFLDGQPKANIAIADDNKVTLNRDPQRPRPLIVLLNPTPKK